MAKVAKTKKGVELAEYPKLLRITEHTKDDKGIHRAEKIKVNSKEEEEATRKEYDVIDGDPVPVKKEPVKVKKAAGWGK